jgi:5-methylcytosine-specific restriction endonuclease McrA
MSDDEIKPKRKPIPKALREQIWLKDCGRVFDHKCNIKWCKNIITVYDYEVGHNIPYSKGGQDTLDNLFAICSRCNRSMSDNYTIKEFSDTFLPEKRNKKWWQFWV